MKMHDDPHDAQARHHHPQAFRRRLRDSQREDLLSAARVMIPQHGLAVALGRIAVHAGLTRHAAHALFNATTDLAAVLVRQALMALIEITAEPRAATAEDFLTRLIAAIRSDAPAIASGSRSAAAGSPGSTRSSPRRNLLVLSIEDCLTPVWPGLPADGTTGLGRRVLALARAAALAPDRPDAPSEAAVIAGMLTASLAHLTPAPAEATAAAVPPKQAAVSVQPPEHPEVGTGRAAVARPAHTPPHCAHDPPACTAEGGGTRQHDRPLA